MQHEALEGLNSAGVAVQHCQRLSSQRIPEAERVVEGPADHVQSARWQVEARERVNAARVAAEHCLCLASGHWVPEADGAIRGAASEP